MNRNTGFTLPELLVLITAGALLAALTVPGLNDAQEKARATACVNSLREIGMAVQLYANDYNGYLCPTATAKNPTVCTGGNKVWVEFLAPYINRTKTDVLVLAQDKEGTVFWGCPTYRIRNPGVLASRFGYGMVLYPGRPTDVAPNDGYKCLWPNGKWFRLDILSHPTSRILVGDSCDWHLGMSGSSMPDTSVDSVSKTIQGERHNGVANYLFVDGHVQAVPPAQAKAALLDPATSGL